VEFETVGAILFIFGIGDSGAQTWLRLEISILRVVDVVKELLFGFKPEAIHHHVVSIFAPHLIVYIQVK
jgi:hypothetical protein